MVAIPVMGTGNSYKVSEAQMTLWEALSLLSPVAIYNIIARSNEHGKRDVVESIIGSAPYYPPGDSGQEWVKTKDEPLTHERVIRKGKK